MKNFQLKYNLCVNIWLWELEIHQNIKDRKLDAFESKCLQKIQGIGWKVSSLMKECEKSAVSAEIQHFLKHSRC